MSFCKAYYGILFLIFSFRSGEVIYISIFQFKPEMHESNKELVQLNFKLSNVYTFKNYQFHFDISLNRFLRFLLSIIEFVSFAWYASIM